MYPRPGASSTLIDWIDPWSFMQTPDQGRPGSRPTFPGRDDRLDDGWDDGPGPIRLDVLLDAVGLILGNLSYQHGGFDDAELVRVTVDMVRQHSVISMEPTGTELERTRVRPTPSERWRTNSVVDRRYTLSVV